MDQSSQVKLCVDNRRAITKVAFYACGECKFALNLDALQRNYDVIAEFVWALEVFGTELYEFLQHFSKDRVLVKPLPQ